MKKQALEVWEAASSQFASNENNFEAFSLKDISLITRKSHRRSALAFLLKALNEAKRDLGPSKKPLNDEMTIYKSIKVF